MLTDDKVLVLPKVLAEKIENRYEEISWSEFIAALIDSLDTEKPKIRKTGKVEYITRKELIAFEEDMKQLMKNFLDFFMTYGLEAIRNGQLVDVNSMTNKLDRLHKDLDKDSGPKGASKATIRWKP